MQLIDALEAREDKITFIEPEKLRFDLDLFVPVLEADGVTYYLDLDALPDFLTMLKIPSKFWQRCAESIDGTQLSVDIVNYWLQKHAKLRLIVQQQTVTQLMPASRAYISAAEVNDIIIESLTDPVVIEQGIFDGVYHAFYLGTETYLNYQIGVRVLFSDTFNVTPRFDAIYYCKDGIIAWSVSGRKFQTNGLTTGILRQQVEEFVLLSKQQLAEYVNPWLEHPDFYKLTDTRDFIYRLAAELRMTRTARAKLINHVEEESLAYNELILKLSLAPIDIEQQRAVQIACSRYLVTRNFK